MAVPETGATLIDGIIRWSRRLIPDRERAERLADDLLAETWRHASHAGPITEQTLREVETVCHRTARHLTLELRPAAPIDVDVVGWPPVPQHVIERRAGFVRRVERFENGCGLLRIDGFDDITHSAGYLLGQ